MAKMKDQQLVETAGRNIAKARLARGLTQVELGLLLGISQLQVNDYENGHSELTLTGVKRLMKVLRIKSIEELCRK